MKGAYIGDANGKAKKIRKIFIGDANGKARRIIKGYIGNANGRAAQFWRQTSYPEVVTDVYGTSRCASMGSTRNYIYFGGGRTDAGGYSRDVYAVNNEGTVSSCTKLNLSQIYGKVASCGNWVDFIGGFRTVDYAAKNRTIRRYDNSLAQSTPDSYSTNTGVDDICRTATNNEAYSLLQLADRTLVHYNASGAKGTISNFFGTDDISAAENLWSASSRCWDEGYFAFGLSANQTRIHKIDQSLAHSSAIYPFTLEYIGELEYGYNNQLAEWYDSENNPHAVFIAHLGDPTRSAPTVPVVIGETGTLHYGSSDGAYGITYDRACTLFDLIMYGEEYWDEMLCRHWFEDMGANTFNWDSPCVAYSNNGGNFMAILSGTEDATDFGQIRIIKHS